MHAALWLVFDTLDFGFPIQNFDSVRTDEYSSVELRLDPATGIDASISVAPSTHFYVNVSNLRSEQIGSVELLGGSISVVARELAGRSRLQIRTHSSVAGVRGAFLDGFLPGHGTMGACRQLGVKQCPRRLKAYHARALARVGKDASPDQPGVNARA